MCLCARVCVCVCVSWSDTRVHRSLRVFPLVPHGTGRGPTHLLITPPEVHLWADGQHICWASYCFPPPSTRPPPLPAPLWRRENRPAADFWTERQHNFLKRSVASINSPASQASEKCVPRGRDCFRCHSGFWRRPVRTSPFFLVSAIDFSPGSRYAGAPQVVALKNWCASGESRSQRLLPVRYVM